MAVDKPPKWQQEVEEMLLKSELTSGEPDIKATSILEDIKEKGGTLDQLKEAWGNPAEWETPQNYHESNRLLQRHYSIWRRACWRAQHRYERTMHMLEIDAPSIIIDKEKGMLSEAFRYLCCVTNRFSFNLLLGVYKPPKRHWDKYYKWLGTKLKIKDVSPDDAVLFFMSIHMEGKIGLRRRNDTVEIIFYFPKGKEPVAWKGRAVRYGGD
jgi:hypothetical protein